MQTFYHLIHGRHHKSARTAAAVQHFLVVFRVDHIDRHFHHVARGEELASVTAQVGPYNLLVCFAFDVNICVEQRIFLEFSHKERQRSWSQLDGVVFVKDLWVLFLDFLKNLGNPFIDRCLPVFVVPFLGGGVKLDRLKQIAFIVNLAEDHL